MALGEDVGVKVSLGVGAPRRQVAKLAPLHRGQRVDRQGQRGLGERRLHVGEVEAVRVLAVELEDLVAGVEACGRQSTAAGQVKAKTPQFLHKTTGEFHRFQISARRRRCCCYDSGVQRTRSAEPTLAARRLRGSGESEGGRREEVWMRL